MFNDPASRPIQKMKSNIFGRIGNEKIWDFYSSLDFDLKLDVGFQFDFIFTA